ncbi:MAG TPA: hypothetical protein VFP42_01705 [Acidimicrobiia bacterium]|nr:hypothetical protein [Acidimicrobiia bacterium]
MRHDVIDRLVRPANPVPNPQSLGADLVSMADERERRGMQHQQVEADQVAERSRNGHVTWIGVAAAVALVIGGLIIFQATEDGDVASATPIAVANEYLDAYANFDVDRVASMLAEDAVVVPWEPNANRTDWQSDLRYLDAVGFELLVGECREIPPLAEGSRVNCEYEAHGFGSDRIGLDPFGGSLFRLVINDGKVTRSDMGFNFTDFAGTMWFPFQDWILENHSDDYAVMYESENLSRQTDDALALWEQRVEDYVAYVSGQ